MQEAAEQSVAAPTIAASLDSRYLSARKDERVAASEILEGPPDMPPIDKQQLLEDLHAALYCSKVCSYAQGMGIIKAASDKNGWDVDLSLCARYVTLRCVGEVYFDCMDRQHAVFTHITIILYSSEIVFGAQVALFVPNSSTRFQLRLPVTRS